MLRHLEAALDRAFPPGIDESRSDPRRGGWDGMHIPTSADATAGIEKWGSLRARPPVPLRRSRPGGRDATESRTTTCAVAVVHSRTAISRTCTTSSHVRSPHGPGPAFRVRTNVSPSVRARHAPVDPRQNAYTVRIATSRTCWTTCHWSNTPCSATFRSRRSCSPSSKGIERWHAREEAAGATAPASGAGTA